MYRVMFQAPATRVTYVVQEVEATPCVRDGVAGWTVQHPENVWPREEFVPAAADERHRTRLYEDFDDADMSRHRWQEQMDAYLAKKERKAG